MVAPRPRPTVVPASRAQRRGALAALATSFRHAWDGVVDTAVHQRNMRIHLVSGLLVALLGSSVPFAGSRQLALALCVVLVLAAEAANTALEALVDLVILENHARARLAKDAGAAGVLIVAVGSVLVLAIVVLEDRQLLVANRNALLRQAAAGLPLAGALAVLLAPSRRGAWVDPVLLAVGGASLIAVTALGRSVPFAVLAALLFAVGVAVARRRGAALARS